MKRSFYLVLILLAAIALVGFSVGSDIDAQQTVQLDESQFKIELPKVVLTDVPVAYVRISALDVAGNFDPTYNGQPLIRGISLSKMEERVDGSFRVREDVEIPPFKNGELELKTDRARGVKLYITDSEIVVDPESRRRGTKIVWRTQRWFSLLPPVLAIVLAVWLRHIVLALFAAVWGGATVLAHGNFFVGFVDSLDTFLIGQLVQIDPDGGADHSHMMIILFTMFLGAMIGVMSRSGGTQGLVNKLSRFTSKREHGQLATWGMGLFIFFDDYANTLLVGSTMRPVTDRLKISREKLAFLIDSTAAPVAGLAVVSTWVGVEVGYIEDTYADLFGRTGYEWDAYSTFLATLPYRFYPLHLLVFVWLIAYSGHDYGPMLKAEARALALGQVSRPQADVPPDNTDDRFEESGSPPLARNALIPIALLLGLIVIGLWWTGSNGLAEKNLQREQAGRELLPNTFWSIFTSASANKVLFLSSFIASISAVSISLISRSLSIRESIEAWAVGAKSMFYAVIILVLAWAVAMLCDPENLNTAGFLVELMQGKIDAKWMPALAFLLAGVVAFATGSSWSTMGLLMPLFISLTFYILTEDSDVDPNHPLMLGTIGGVLAGAIFGDHCSPISDTTVLSSAAAGSDHLDHVMTQLPYSVSVALVALLLGYIPVGFAYSPLVLMPLGLIVLYTLVQFLGRPVEKVAEEMLAERAAQEAGAVAAAEEHEDDVPRKNADAVNDE